MGLPAVSLLGVLLPIMIDKPASLVSKIDIDLLVERGRIEDRTIEYKRDLPGTSDEERREFLRDISSFANAQGGDILYGIEEVAGVPTAAPGVVISNFDELRLRLQSMIHSSQASPPAEATELMDRTFESRFDSRCAHNGHIPGTFLPVERWSLNG